MKTTTWCAVALLSSAALTQTTAGLARGSVPGSPPSQAGDDVPGLVVAPVYAARFKYPATAVNTLYGTGCGGTIQARRPDAGFDFFAVDLDAGAANAGLNAWLLIGTTPGGLDLAPVGMPSCFLNVNTLAMVGPLTLNGSGVTSLQLPLPDAPVLIGDVYFQWLYLSLGVPWPTKFATSRGLKTEIR